MNSNIKEINKEQYCSKDIIELLKQRFSDSRHYSYATEVGNSTGSSQTRRIDFCVIDHYTKDDFAIEGIEVKISKADLMTELRNPKKHNIFFENINYYSLACPGYILDKKVKELIPAHWGVYVVKDGKLRLHRKPTPLHDKRIDKIDRSFVSAFIRRISQPQADDLNRKLKEEYERGWLLGQEHERNIQEKTKELLHGRKKDYAESYQELLEVLDTQNYKLKDAIPVLKLIVENDTGRLKEHIEDTLKGLNELVDILDKVEIDGNDS